METPLPLRRRATIIAASMHRSKLPTSLTAPFLVLLAGCPDDTPVDTTEPDTESTTEVDSSTTNPPDPTTTNPPDETTTTTDPTTGSSSSTGPDVTTTTTDPTTET